MHPSLRRAKNDTADTITRTAAHATAALRTVADRPAAYTGPTPQPRPLGEGAGFDGALAEFTQRWAPGFSGSTGPRYLGFVTGGATPAAVAGDWLAAIYDQNPVSTGDSTACGLASETLRRLRELLDLPPQQHGVFVSGATMSNMVSLALARQWAGEKAGVDVARQGTAALGEVPVLSGAAHSSVRKALAMLGVGRDSLREVGTTPGREAVDLEALGRMLEDTSGPVIVVANAGTVNTGDFDDLRGLLRLRERFGFWLHVDAAFGAFATLSPSHAHLAAGIGEADSVCIDLHKWLNVPYDSAVQFTRHPRLRPQVFGNHAAYLGDTDHDPDPVDLAPENSRRLRALPAWFALAAYGRAGHADIVTRNIAAAQRLGELLDASPRFRLLAPVRLNIACFTVADAAQRASEVAATVAADGRTFVTPTVYQGFPALRAAFSNWRTELTDVDTIAAALEAAV